MKTSTVVAVGIVCACVAVTALLSRKRDHLNWVTAAPAMPAAVTRGPAPTSDAKTPVPRTAGLTPGTKQWDDASVRDILHNENQPLTDENVSTLKRVALRDVSGPDDPVIVERMALAISGDQAVLPATPPRQATELKGIVVSCLSHPAWRMRRSALGTSFHNGWMAEQSILSRVEEMAKSDPSVQARQEAARAVEQRTKLEAFRAAGGKP